MLKIVTQLVQNFSKPLSAQLPILLGPCWRLNVEGADLYESSIVTRGGSGVLIDKKSMGLSIEEDSYFIMLSRIRVDFCCDFYMSPLFLSFFIVDTHSTAYNHSTYYLYDGRAHIQENIRSQRRPTPRARSSPWTRC